MASDPLETERITLRMDFLRDIFRCVLKTFKEHHRHKILQAFEIQAKIDPITGSAHIPQRSNIIRQASTRTSRPFD